MSVSSQACNVSVTAVRWAGGQAEASDMLRDTGGSCNPGIVAVARCI